MEVIADFWIRVNVELHVTFDRLRYETETNIFLEHTKCSSRWHVQYCHGVKKRTRPLYFGHFILRNGYFDFSKLYFRTKFDCTGIACMLCTNSNLVRQAACMAAKKGGDCALCNKNVRVLYMHINI